jgi:hypothetical protein
MRIMMDWKVEDVITTDRYLAAFPNNYFKTDVFYHGPIEWRGRIVYPPTRSYTLLVVGHSDYPITENIANRHPNAKWWCANKQTSKVNGLPLGITNDCNDSSIHRIYGNIPMMVEVVSSPRTIQNLLYVNFSLNTYPAERVPLMNYLKNNPWVTVEDSVSTMEGRRKYLQSIRNHTFVACPRGNGVDTHRLWETLYMGSIPIVIRDIAHSDWMDLPILWIDSWNQVNQEYLFEQEKLIRSKEWNTEKLKVGYWIAKITQG